ncbi:MAG: hypothetical protein QXD11_01195 [Candidatus Micrarchaeaceae archaeon]
MDKNRKKRSGKYLCTKGQSSIEYIMMLSAVSIIIVIALAMMTQLKGTAIHNFYNSSNSSLAIQLNNELQNLSNIKR